ncbi:MAG: RDD family protein [Pseudomonadota bacterium]
MSDESYKVIIQGTIREGHDHREVVAALSRAFKQDGHITEKLVSGVPRIIKKGLDKASALKYQEILEGMGVVSSIEPELPPVKIQPAESPPADSADVVDQPNRRSCPRCGYHAKSDDDVLLVRGDCPKCGLMVNNPMGRDHPPDEDFVRRTAAVDRAAVEDYADLEYAPLKTRALASMYTFGVFSLVCICLVIAFMIFFFPLTEIPYHIAKNFLVTAYGNFPMLLAATGIFFVNFLFPLIAEGQTWGQREFGIGIRYTAEAETGGLLLTLTFRTAAIGLLTFSPGLLAIKAGGILGYADSLQPYIKLIMVLMAASAWAVSWLFLMLSPAKRGILDIAAGTIQIEERTPQANPLLKALAPLGSALGFALVFGVLTPLLFR